MNKTALFRFLKRVAASRYFNRFYGFVCFLILAGSTIFWSILGGRLQQSNADQLINSYLFENSNTLHSAQIPGAHTFLIKWPIFLLIKLFGFSSATFITFTVILCLVTVVLLALLLYKIDRRPIVFGTLCLGLASVLLLVPAQPYAGGLLPVNMAMIATRNLEYVLFIASLAIFVSSPKIRSWRFWLAVIFLSLLIASDKLFFSLSAGGALIALIIYALTKGWNLVSTSVNWLVGTLLGGIAAAALLWLIDKSGLVHIVTVSKVAPYGLVSSFHNAALGVIFAILNLATNFGANPAYDATTLTDVHHQVLTRLHGLGGIAFIVNAAILILGVIVMTRLVLMSLAHNRNREVELTYFVRLSVLLIWTSLASIIIFVGSDHYYAVDSRYLTICLFTLFISLAAYASARQWRPEKALMAGSILLVTICLGFISAYRTYAQDQVPLNNIRNRDKLVSQALAQHPVKVLVGDYWRVVPQKYLNGAGINIMPLQSCSQARDVLTSKDWQVDLTKNSFAYLLSFDKSLTDYPSCSLKQVIDNFGRPNSSLVIDGSLSSPKEILLFFDHGAHKSSPKIQLKTPSTVLPVQLDELPYTTCPVPSVMNIVAHQDDDLLFMSPDLTHDIRAGHCVRTIYVTAGDAGANQFYWLSREQGSEAAYSVMTGSSDIWINRVVQLPSHQYITVANPRGNSKISLIFIHLPDGNVKGQGFASTQFESLEKLDGGKINSMTSVYSQSVFTKKDLIDSLVALMQTYAPAEIRTQANLVSAQYPDHSDHMAVGRLVKQAYQNYEAEQFEGKVSIPLKFYVGYPVHAMPENVANDDLQIKEEAFFNYAKYDGGVCRTIEDCAHHSVYGIYLKRQYQNAY